MRQRGADRLGHRGFECNLLNAPIAFKRICLIINVKITKGENNPGKKTVTKKM